LIDRMMAEINPPTDGSQSAGRPTAGRMSGLVQAIVHSPQFLNVRGSDFVSQPLHNE
jgi:hypothetical protein